jgi:hypothetical protein
LQHRSAPLGAELNPPYPIRARAWASVARTCSSERFAAEVVGIWDAHLSDGEFSARPATRYRGQIRHRYSQRAC